MYTIFISSLESGSSLSRKGLLYTFTLRAANLVSKQTRARQTLAEKQ